MKALDLTQGAPWYQAHPTPLDYIGGESDTPWLEANLRAWLRGLGGDGSLLSQEMEDAFRAGYLAANRRWIQQREEKQRCERYW